MTKEEFLQFLRDPEICKEIFEIVKKGGKPSVPAQTVIAPKVQPQPSVQPTQPKFSSIADKLKFMYGQGGDTPKQPTAPQPQPAAPKVQTPQSPKPEAPKGSGSLADKLKLLRGHLDKVREEEQIAAAAKVEEKTVAEKFTVIANRKCPICENDTRVVKPKARLNVEKRDVDYCVHYKDFDPYLYTIFSCEHCGFAAEEKKFIGAWPKKIKDTLREFLKQNDMKLPFVEERNVEDALSLFELAILFSELTDQSKGRQAILNLNAAWVCRCEGLADKERELLEQAAADFATALDGERWPINGISDDMATYLCAAIYYLIKDYEKATNWLGKTMNNANLRASAPKLFEQARDMWQDIKRANKA